MYFKNSDVFIYDEFILDGIDDLSKIPFVSKVSKNNFSGYNNKTIYLDYDSLKFPLIFSKIKNTDLFNFLGTKKNQKCLDFLSKKKISVLQKDNTYVLKNLKNEVLVIFPNYISEKVKLTEQGNSYLMLDLS